VVGCGASLPALPSQGGPAWFELQSEHVTLWTDAPPRRARELIDSIELRRQVIVRAMNRADQRGRIFAIALRSARELEAFLPPPFAAFAWSDGDNPSRQPGVVISAEDAEVDGDQGIVNHELAHAISGAFLKNQPAWLAEGLATYFEMGELDAERQSVQIGIPRRDRLILVRQARTVSAAELFACQGLACRTDEFYATAWALFSYLLNEHFDRFARYLQRLNALPRSRQRDAWREIFPELTPARVDHLLAGWMYSGSFAVPRIAVTPRRYPVVARKLGDADVHAVRGLLFRMTGKREASRAAAEAALALTRTHLLAWLVARTHNLPISDAEARAVAAAHPGDWRAWELLRNALESGTEAEAAHTRMCALLAVEGNGCDPRS
jgi:hypothetical protein